jgi:hypothetical protein
MRSHIDALPSVSGRGLHALTRTRACGDLRHELGVYVLGAVTPADRSAIDSHLASCAGCRDELAELAGLPALLATVPAGEVDGLGLAGDDSSSDGPSPDQRLRLLISRTASLRRYRLWTRVAAAATIGLLVGAAATFGAMSGPAQQPAASARQGGITVRASNPRTDASATVTYAARPWGVELYVQVSGVRAGTRCTFEVTDSSGQESVAGGWAVAVGHEDAWYAASSSVPVSDVRGFAVTAGARALVRVLVPVAPTQMKGRR